MSYLPHALLLLLPMVASMGCQDALPEPNPEGLAYTFPHPEGFDAGALHGAPWKESPEGCTQCHRSEQRVGMVESCRGCHPDYPHPEGFSDSELHGGAGAHGGARCAGCHGSGEKQPAGQADAACRDCHQDYPHRVTFREPNIHGPRSHADRSGCAACHGLDWQGSVFADACAECHASYPHSTARSIGDTGLLDAWGLPSVHGAEARVQGNTACGGACHGEDFTGGATGGACFDCHGPYPHGEDIRVEHRELVHAHGEASCLGCHTTDRGFPAAFGCTDACHREGP